MSRFARIVVAALASGAWQPPLARAQEGEYGASARVRADLTVGSTAIESEEATARPGALGEPARALLDAAGAARTSFLGGELVLWGAAPSESQTYVDGVEIPNLFHPSGLRTTVHPALIESVTLTPGALPAAYGRSLGGAVDVQTVRLKPGFEATLRSDAIDSSLAVSGGTRRVRALAGVRYGYFDRVVARIAPDSQEVLAVPSHQDGVARVELRADADTRLSATWIGARDHVDLQTDTGQQTRTNQFHVGSLLLERRYDDAARMRVTPFVGIARRAESSTFYGVPMTLETSETSYGLRADYRRTENAWTTQIGVDVRGARQRVRRQGTLSLPAREGDVRVFGQAPIDEVDRDAYRATTLNVGPWASLTWRWRALTVAPSVRLETYLLSVDRQLPTLPGIPAVGRDRLFVEPEPRLTVDYRALPWLTLEGRTGLYHQAPLATDLSATYGTPTLPPARAFQSALGARLTLPWAIGLELTVFEKQLRDLAVRTDDAPARIAQQLEPTGRGTARGLTVQVRREMTSDVFFAASYTLSRSERSERSDARAALRPFDYDQTHVMSAIVGYTRGDFVASVRARTATGAPRTSVVGRYDDLKTGRAQPLFGPHNETPLPTYFALDLHAEYGLRVEPLRIALFADVLNTTDRRNVEDFTYDARYERRRDVTSIPIVAMAGLSIRGARD